MSQLRAHNDRDKADQFGRKSQDSRNESMGGWSNKCREKYPVRGEKGEEENGDRGSEKEG